MFKSIINKAEEIVKSLYDWHDLLTNFNYYEIIKIGIVILLLITFLIILRKIVKKIKIKKISSKFPLAIKKYNDTCNMSRYWRKRTRKNMPSFSDGISKWRKFENQLIKEKQEEEKVSLIRRKYPLGFSKCFNNSRYINNTQVIANEYFIIKYEHEERRSQFYNNWINTQEEFSQKCRNLRDKVLPNWGCYIYELKFPVNINKKFKVWQLFNESFSEESDLDYSLYPSAKNNAKDKPKLLSKKIFYIQSVYDKIIEFLIALKKSYYGDGSRILLQYGDSGLFEYKELNDFHFKDFQAKALKAGFSIITNTAYHQERILKFISNQKVRLVIIDLVTSNDNLKYICQREIDILNKSAEFSSDYNSFVDVVYISLLKQYDRREMLSILANEERELERKKKEEKANYIRRNYSDGFFKFRSDYDGSLTDDIIIANEYNIKHLDYKEKERKKREEKERIEREELNALSNSFKYESTQILNLLRSNNINCFYHFTDRSNIESIKRLGGLYSWHYLKNKKQISIPRQGGTDFSEQLDRRYGLQDYVRLSFCPDHPMAYRLMQEGADIVVLRISIDVATFRDTLFSDINATDSNHKNGPSLSDLQRVNFFATQRTYVSRTDPLFKALQAEVMVKTHVPLRFITNIDDF